MDDSNRVPLRSIQFQQNVNTYTSVASNSSYTMPPLCFTGNMIPIIIRPQTDPIRDQTIRPTNWSGSQSAFRPYVQQCNSPMLGNIRPNNSANYLLHTRQIYPDYFINSPMMQYYPMPTSLQQFVIPTQNLILGSRNDSGISSLYSTEPLSNSTRSADLSASLESLYRGPVASDSQHISIGTGLRKRCTDKCSTSGESINDGDIKKKCAVCGDTGTGVHYGVDSCEGCKGFFRRSMQQSASYECARGGNCSIDLINRNSCQSCRLRKCREVGMRRDAIRSERIGMKKFKGDEKMKNAADTTRSVELIAKIMRSFEKNFPEETALSCLKSATYLFRRIVADVEELKESLGENGFGKIQITTTMAIQESFRETECSRLYLCGYVYHIKHFWNLTNMFKQSEIRNMLLIWGLVISQPEQDLCIHGEIIKCMLLLLSRYDFEPVIANFSALSGALAQLSLAIREGVNGTNGAAQLTSIDSNSSCDIESADNTLTADSPGIEE